MTSFRFFSIDKPKEAPRAGLPDVDRVLSTSTAFEIRRDKDKDKEKKQDFSTDWRLPGETTDAAANVIRAVHNQNYPLAANLLTWMPSVERYAALDAFYQAFDKGNGFARKVEEFCEYLKSKALLTDFYDHLRVIADRYGGPQYTSYKETSDDTSSYVDGPESVFDITSDD